MSESLSITSTEENIMKVFLSNLYIIPVYQRTYSWDIEKCEQLWDDLNEFIEISNDSLSAYFLGTIIATSEVDIQSDIILNKKETKYSVIDGQQRLTTLSILMSALYKRDSRNKDLLDSIYSKDPREEGVKVSQRVISQVNNNSEALLFTSCFEETEYSKNLSNKTCFKNERYNENFDWFIKKIDKLNPDEVSILVDTILYNVTLLKVVVPKRSDALVIFKTINDRGMQLNESDILKSNMYDVANRNNEGENFIEEWENLNERISSLSEKIKDFDMPTLFRYYMHVKRGINGETTKEVSLLDFFKGRSIDKNKDIPENNIVKTPWRNIINDLDRLCGTLEWLNEKKYKGDIALLYNALICYNNLYPYYSIIVYLFHRIVKNENIWYLENQYKNAFIEYFEKILAFAYSIVFLKPGVNAIKDPIYKIIVDASKGVKKVLIQNNTKYNKDDFNLLEQNLKSSMILKIARGYLVLLIYLNNKTDKTINIFDAKTELTIEHILPRKWENNFYYNWDKRKAEDVINKLGNLILMDRSCNIKASNLWFSKKKEKYNESRFKHGELIDLLDTKSDSWSYNDFLLREENTVRTLMHFFREQYK